MPNPVIDVVTDIVAELDLPLRGRFDLEQSIGFGFGGRDVGEPGVMRLAFCLDGLTAQVGVAVRQPDPQQLRLQVVADGEIDLDAVAAQVARVLSVDVDGRGYDELGDRDELVGRVQQARPGLRPPLFYSAYEAALWGVLSARQHPRAMAAIRERLSREHGRVFEVAGQQVAAVPLPERLARIGDVPGLSPVKLPRLHALAEVAGAGRLDTAQLRALELDDARARVRELPGIGPFFAELIVVRTLGHTDVLPSEEPIARDVAGQLLGAPDPFTAEDFEAAATRWTPWRTWVAVAMRAGGAQLGVTPRVSRRRSPRGDVGRPSARRTV